MAGKGNTTFRCPRHTRGTMPRESKSKVELKNCPVREVLDRVGDKWSVLVLHLLATGTHRFGELRTRIDGISQRMLTVTLRGLERDGLVTRTIYPVVPPRVEYDLTELGRSLSATVCSLVDWAGRHTEAIDQARERYDRDRERDRERESRPAPAASTRS
jgi:DNA-binding HxlR family transcriptional regulator